jgi:hypothetical protein
MPALFLFLLQGMESLLEWFTGDTSVADWQSTAISWLIAAVVIAATCTGLMVLIKAFMKMRAPNPRGRIWPRGKAVIFILTGLFPVLVSVSSAWYLSRDYTNIITISGLFKGVLFAWVLYILLMLVSHAWGEWREDLF